MEQCEYTNTLSKIMWKYECEIWSEIAESREIQKLCLWSEHMNTFLFGKISLCCYINIQIYIIHIKKLFM